MPMSFIQRALNTIFPPLCVHCHREGAWLCPIAIALLEEEQPLLNPVQIPDVDRVLTRGSYDCPSMSSIVQAIKYNYWTGSTILLRPLLAPLRSYLSDMTSATIVPVPLHTRRLRERGFNQSMYIAKALSAELGQPVVNLLRRTTYTTPQATLTARERITNIVGAINSGDNTSWPSSVILVDDVITTGSTIAECAKVLRHNGVQHICAVAIAKG